MAREIQRRENYIYPKIHGESLKQYDPERKSVGRVRMDGKVVFSGFYENRKKWKKKLYASVWNERAVNM